MYLSQKKNTTARCFFQALEKTFLDAWVQAVWNQVRLSYTRLQDARRQAGEGKKGFKLQGEE